MDPRSELLKLIATRAYQEGDFLLASGQTSSFYLDLKAVTLSPLGAVLLGRLAVDCLQKTSVLVQGVGGLTLGADPIATAVSIAAFEQGLNWPAFIVRKEPKSHGTSRYIEGTENLAQGAELVVLEDVVTTGSSSLKAIEKLRAAHYRPRAVLTLVDREQGGRQAIEEQEILFLALYTIKEVKAAFAALA